MQMNFADGMDWTRRGIHFVCVYSVDELCRWHGLDTKRYTFRLVYLVIDELRIAGGMDWTRRGIHSVLCIFSC